MQIIRFPTEGSLKIHHHHPPSRCKTIVLPSTPKNFKLNILYVHVWKKKDFQICRLFQRPLLPSSRSPTQHIQAPVQLVGGGKNVRRCESTSSREKNAYTSSLKSLKAAFINLVNTYFERGCGTMYSHTLAVPTPRLDNSLLPHLVRKCDFLRIIFSIFQYASPAPFLPDTENQKSEKIFFINWWEKM